MSVGYACKATRQQAISIDFSLNEEIFAVKDIEIELEGRLKDYTLADIVAEKLRGPSRTGTAGRTPTTCGSSYSSG